MCSFWGGEYTKILRLTINAYACTPFTGVLLKAHSQETTDTLLVRLFLIVHILLMGSKT